MHALHATTYKQTAIIIVVRPRCACAPQHCYSKHSIDYRHLKETSPSYIIFSSIKVVVAIVVVVVQ